MRVYCQVNHVLVVILLGASILVPLSITARYPRSSRAQALNELHSFMRGHEADDNAIEALLDLVASPTFAYPGACYQRSSRSHLFYASVCAAYFSCFTLLLRSPLRNSIAVFSIALLVGVVAYLPNVPIAGVARSSDMPVQVAIYAKASLEEIARFLAVGSCCFLIQHAACLTTSAEGQVVASGIVGIGVGTGYSVSEICIVMPLYYHGYAGALDYVVRTVSIPAFHVANSMMCALVLFQRSRIRDRWIDSVMTVVLLSLLHCLYNATVILGWKPLAIAACLTPCMILARRLSHCQWKSVDVLK